MEAIPFSFPQGEEEVTSHPELQVFNNENTCLDTDSCNSDSTIRVNAEFRLKMAYLAIGVVGMTGNLFVMIVISMFKHLRESVTNKFIIHQSLVDLLASFFIITTSFLEEMPEWASQLGKEMICRLWLTNMPLWATSVVSTYNVVMMTFERYIAIVHPLKPSWKILHTKAYLLMALAWLVGIINTVPFTILTSKITDDGVCTMYTEWPSDLLKKIIAFETFLIQFLLPFFLNIFANAHIALILRQQSTGQSEAAASNNRKTKMVAAQRNVFKTLLFVFIANVICWVWNAVYGLIHNAGIVNLSFNSTFYHFTIIAVFVNSCLNPFFYAIQYRQYRKALKTLFICKRLGKCWGGKCLDLPSGGDNEESK